MKKKVEDKINELIIKYNHVMEIMEHDAKKSMKNEGRAYGGFVRMAKGKIQEFITEELIKTAWIVEMEQRTDRLLINSDKIKIPIKQEYIENLRNDKLKEYIKRNINNYHYGLSVDKHVFIDRKFVIGIECKAYTENAMLKRILVDFMLLKTKYKDLRCFLFQLESQLGGDYSELKSETIGSEPTHTIMSYFENVELNIVTLLKGERKVDKPINKPEFFKELRKEPLEHAIEELVLSLNKFIK